MQSGHVVPIRPRVVPSQGPGPHPTYTASLGLKRDKSPLIWLHRAEVPYVPVEGVDGRGPTLKGSNVPAEGAVGHIKGWLCGCPGFPIPFLRLQLTASAGRAGQVLGCVITFEIMLADSCAAVIAAIAAVGVRFGTHADARYLALSLLLPLLRMTAVRLFGGTRGSGPSPGTGEDGRPACASRPRCSSKDPERIEQMSHQDYSGKGVARTAPLHPDFTTVNIRQ